jgi:PD-(D/E)XK nuclease superfamily protein
LFSTSRRGSTFSWTTVYYIELKAVEAVHQSSKARLFSYMKLLDIPIGLLINFHEPVLKNGIFRMILPGANQGSEDAEAAL